MRIIKFIPRLCPRSVLSPERADKLYRRQQPRLKAFRLDALTLTRR